MPYICCGDPSAGFTLKLAETLSRGGADAIELGIPFSDPAADGRVLQAASSRALKAGMTPKKALCLLAKLRGRGLGIPVIIMAYYNTFCSHGTGRFISGAAKAGADGVVVPDLPLEESREFRKECARARICFVPLVSPDCRPARIARISRGAGGFLYAVSVAGTTGARRKVERQSLLLVKRAKTASGMPVAAGFGISTPAHARLYARCGADGVIVGSRIAEIYAAHAMKGMGGEKRAMGEIARYCRSMKKACSGKR
jgi:tryptophan synthase alpha chain